MVDRLRTPFFVLAIVLIFITLLIEIGMVLPNFLPSSSPPVQNFLSPSSNLSNEVNKFNQEQPGAIDKLNRQSHPPGISIPDMALLDGIVLFTVTLMGIALLIPARLQGRVQGIATLIFSLILIGIALLLILVAFTSLILMISLLLSAPFGTIAYLIIYGSFNRAGADIALSLLMLLKFGFCISLFFAQQRFLQNRGLVLLILSSLLCNVIVSFLQGLVPSFLISITDAVAAILVSIIALIWAVFLFIGSIISIIKIINL